MRTPDGEMFQGATQEPGGPHAEVVALAAAGERTRGATLYVTLEPCAHHGRTGPCSDAIISAGVARVVVGDRRPRPPGGGQGCCGPARRRHRGRARGAGRQGRPAARSVPEASAHGSTVGGAQAGGLARWRHRCAQRFEPVDHLTPRARSMVTGCEPSPTRSWSVPERYGVTTPRSRFGTTTRRSSRRTAHSTRRRIVLGHAPPEASGAPVSGDGRRSLRGAR